MTGAGEAAVCEVEMLDEPLKAVPVVPAPELTMERAFKDMETILYSIAASPSHYRNFAVHYMRCRNVLLGGECRAMLPGFLIQCGTSDKFRDFVCLYDASAEARRAFLDNALSRCRAALGWTRSYDIFDDEDF
jgi:hypothetical protein